mmetsp:Transcript_4386/g.14159  ORF Transcript_4386/g.14159 Transcript_4386/m.14159 type:complete len:377 (+) Transcript_4386:1578-2708(+)
MGARVVGGGPLVQRPQMRPQVQRTSDASFSPRSGAGLLNPRENVRRARYQGHGLPGVHHQPHSGTLPGGGGGEGEAPPRRRPGEGPRPPLLPPAGPWRGVGGGQARQLLPPRWRRGRRCGHGRAGGFEGGGSPGGDAVVLLRTQQTGLLRSRSPTRRPPLLPQRVQQGLQRQRPLPVPCLLPVPDPPAALCGADGHGGGDCGRRDRVCNVPSHGRMPGPARQRGRRAAAPGGDDENPEGQPCGEAEEAGGGDAAAALQDLPQRSYPGEASAPPRAPDEVFQSEPGRVHGHWQRVALRVLHLPALHARAHCQLRPLHARVGGADGGGGAHEGAVCAASGPLLLPRLPLRLSRLPHVGPHPAAHGEARAGRAERQNRG